MAHVEREASGTWPPARRAYASQREPATWGRGRRICVASKRNPPKADEPHCGEYQIGQAKTKRIGLVRQGGLDENFLKWCFWQLKRDAAAGVNRVDFYEYRENLEENIANLVKRLKKKKYRAKLVRRQYISKLMTPLGPSTAGTGTIMDETMSIFGIEVLLAVVFERNYFFLPKGMTRISSGNFGTK